MGISERSRTVLSQVVTLHYRTCGPVGSALICKSSALGCSPATIRNVMMRLESKGYLCQPHTSAGRLPTDLGYRTYVNDIMLTRTDERPIEHEHLGQLIHQSPSPAGALQGIANYIHARTNLLTFSLPFRHSGTRLKHLHLERLNEKSLLVLWVGRGGQTFQSVLPIDAQDMNRPLMEKAANYFNSAFCDCNLLQINRELAQRSSRTDGSWDVMLGKVALIATQLLEEANKLEHITFQGFTKVLEMPEFQDIQRVRTICRLLEQQDHIKQLVMDSQSDQNSWVVFFIGKEMGNADLEHLTVVLSKFRHGSDWLGCVGALGPKRMPYLHALQMFRHAQSKMQGLARLA